MKNKKKMEFGIEYKHPFTSGTFFSPKPKLSSKKKGGKKKYG